MKKGTFLNDLHAKIILIGIIFKYESPKTKIKTNVLSVISVLVYIVS